MFQKNTLKKIKAQTINPYIPQYAALYIYKSYHIYG